MNFTDLPVYALLPELLAELDNSDSLILSAAPGAGKTTLVPAALLEHFPGKILLLEPRRVAARAAAERVSAAIGAKVGEQVGYAVRGEQRHSARTRLLSVTPGVLLRQLQDDPWLSDVSAIIFDEFHERHWEADLALAFALYSRRELGKKLKIVIMSATIDTEKIAALLGGKVLSAPGKMFPVTVQYAPPETPEIAKSCARAVARNLASTSGNILVFLPGVGEIERTANYLAELPPEIDVVKLHGQLSFAEQNRALEASPRRRVCLATNLAESSITVPGITCVIDSGWEKYLRFAPHAGLTYLESRRISRHSADQRAGRAGRTAPGVAIRLFAERDFAALAADNPPEITECDLLPLALELAAWGAKAGELTWLDAPDALRLTSAQAELAELGACTTSGEITALGRQISRLGVHPRLGAMLIRAQNLGMGATAAAIAAFLSESAAAPGSVDLRNLLAHLPPRVRNLADKLRAELHIKAEALRLEECGRLLAFAFPRYVAKRRAPGSADFLLAGSGGARLLDAAGISGDFLAVGRLGGKSGVTAVIQIAAPLDVAELEEDFAAEITTADSVALGADGKVVAARERRLGAIVLGRTPIAPPPEMAVELLLQEAFRRQLALPPPGTPAEALLTRIRFAARSDADFPDWSGEAWQKLLTENLAAFFPQLRSLDELAKLPWSNFLRHALGESRFAALERFYPAAFRTPAGASHGIDYSGEQPTVRAKLQEFFGVKVHPSVGKNHLPLRLELLSPAGRPVQITGDLPGFWRTSWELVKKEMKSRYPKHLWPDDPANTAPTTRTTKPRQP